MERMALEKNKRIKAVIVDDHPIYHAIREEDKQKIDELVDKDPSVLAVSAEIWDGTPLIYAILYAGDYPENKKGDEMALHIINHKPQKYWDVVTETTENNNFLYKGMTPLLAACWAEEPEIVKALVERGADPTESNPEVDHAPLTLTVYRSSGEAEDILEYLLSFPRVRETLKNPVGADGGYTTTVLGAACDGCTRATLFMIQQLLHAGADPTYGGDVSGTSALEIVREERAKLIKRTNLGTDQQKDIQTLDKMEQMFLRSIDESLRARLLFRVRFVADAVKAISAASQDAWKRGLVPDEQRQKAFDATPECLEKRFEVNGPMPIVLYTDPVPSWAVTKCACGCNRFIIPPSDENAEKARTLLELVVNELSDDLFNGLIKMMVPPGDMAWDGEKLGAFLDRVRWIKARL